MWIGGLPEIVDTWVKSKDVFACQKKQDEIIEELGLSNGDVLVDKIIGCDYEVKLTYEIKDENSNVELISATNNE